MLFLRLTCAALLWAAPAGAMQLQPTPGQAPEKKACHTTVSGEKCHVYVRWAQKHGIKESPEWYPGLTMESSLREVQRFLHSKKMFKQHCPMPCAVSEDLTEEKYVEEPAHKKKKKHAEESEPAPEAPAAAVAEKKKNKKHVEEPKPAPEAPAAAEEEAFDAPEQEFSAPEASSTEPPATEAVATRDAVVEEDSFDAPECNTAKEGDECHHHVRWAMKHGIKTNPEWYPGLSKDSSFEEFQSFLHGLDKFRAACPVPCAKEGEVEVFNTDAAPAVAAAAGAAAAAVEAAVSPSEPQAPPNPVLRGCYHWQPTGCPNSGSKKPSAAWLHDEYGEATKGAAASEAACMERARNLNAYCGTDDTRMLFVPDDQLEIRDSGDEEVPVTPQQPAIEPLLAPKPDAEEPPPLLAPGPDAVPQPAAAPQAAPQQQLDEPAESAEAVPAGAPELPSSAGCFVWLPTGCKRKHFPAKEHWKRDEWGEANMRSAESSASCAARKHSFDMYCGVVDAVMHLVPAGGEAAQAPSEMDAAGRSDDFSAPESATAQETSGSSDQSQSLPAEAPERPDSAGCFVWLPTGCKRKHFPAMNHWKRDEWGESNLRSAESAAMCSARKHAFDMWCGVVNAVMLHQAAGAQGATAQEVPATPQQLELPQSTEAAPQQPQQLDLPAASAEAVPAGAPELPDTAGCYVWLPSGCHKKHFPAREHWKRDDWGEENMRSADSSANCAARKHSFDVYCRVTDAVVHLVTGGAQRALPAAVSGATDVVASTIDGEHTVSVDGPVQVASTIDGEHTVSVDGPVQEGDAVYQD